MSESIQSNTSSSEERQSVSPERREYARVMDAIGLEFRSRSVDADEADDGLPASLDGVIDHYELEGYASVKRDFPEITDYIDLLEERIRQLQLGGNILVESPTHKVSISASGVAFADDRLLEPGDIVPLRLTLFPELFRISCDGTVVSVGDISELANDNQHSYRIVFNNIAASDIELIDQHVRTLCKSVRHYPDD